MCLIQDADFNCVLCGSPETFLNTERNVVVCGGCDSTVPRWLIDQPTP
jgi:hypothetical protein